MRHGFLLFITLLLAVSSAPAQLSIDWNMTYPDGIHSPVSSGAQSVDVLPDGGYILADHVVEDLGDIGTSRLIRTDGTGEVLWQSAIMDDEYSLYLNTVVHLPDAGPDQPQLFISSGRLYNYPNPDISAGMVYCHDADGNLVWSQDMRRNNEEWNYEDYRGAVVLPDRSVILAGTATTADWGNWYANAVRLTKIAEDGTILFDSVVNVYEEVDPEDLVLMQDGTMVWAGTVGEYDNAGLLMQFDQAGNTLNQYTFPTGPYSRYMVDIAPAPDGGLYVLLDDHYGQQFFANCIVRCCSS